MTPRKRVGAAPDAPPADPSGPPAPVMVPDSLDAAIAALHEAAGQDPALKLYLLRYNYAIGDYEHLGVILNPREEFDLEKVRLMWGGGKFKGRPRASDGRYLPGVFTFSIAGTPLAGPNAEKKPGDGPPAPVASALAPDAPPWLAHLRERLDRLEYSAASVVPVQADPMTIAAKLAEVSAANFASMVRMMGELAPARAAGSDAAELMELIRFGMELRGTGDGGKGGDLYDALAPLVESVTRALAAPPAAPAEAPAAPPQPQAERKVAVRNVLTTALDFLAPHAARNGDPGVWAQALEDALPGIVPAIEAGIEHYGTQAALLDTLAEADPRVAAARAWYGHVLAWLVLSEEPDGDEQAQDGA